MLEGRDIGSVVFPNARLQVFPDRQNRGPGTTSICRRLGKGTSRTFEQTLAEINERDARDVSRSDSPLTIAADAIVIDTSDLDLSEVFAEMLAKINGHRAKLPKV